MAHNSRQFMDKEGEDNRTCQTLTLAHGWFHPFGRDTERLLSITWSISSGVMIRTASSSIWPLPLIANRMAARVSSSASAIAINSRPPLVGTKYACFISAVSLDYVVTKNTWLYLLAHGPKPSLCSLNSIDHSLLLDGS
jgi:hypothetical protein